MNEQFFAGAAQPERYVARRMRNPNKRKNFDFFSTGKKIKVQKHKVQVFNKSDLPDYWYDTEVTCCGCGIKFIHTAADKVRWYEIEKRPFFIKPVRCHECSKLKNHAIEICSKFDNKKIESLDLNETNEWMEAIKLLKSIGAKYNEAILTALENRLST